MTEALLEPLGYAFVLRALLAASLVGATCAIVGSFVVLRGMSFFGDALAHAVLPGVALGYLLGGGSSRAVFGGALVAALLSATAIARLSARGGLEQDAAIGIVFAGMFALGIAIVSLRQSYAVDLAHILFGDVLGVSDGDLVAIAALCCLVLLAITLLYKELVLAAFDPVQATTLRLPVERLDAVLLVLLALATVAALKAVGVALTVAMLITPASAAYLLARRLPSMIAVGAAIGAGSGIVGIYASYHLSVTLDLSIATGAAIALAATLAFLVALAYRTLAGRRLRAPGPGCRK